jgi:tRNA(Ile)-lysidine synthase
MIKVIEDFLGRRNLVDKPILIGLSGGPDSLALLYSLLQFDLQIYLAHIDHGWREESKIEAETLAQLAKQLGLKFFSKRLPKDIWQGNLELAARNERLKFFRELYFKHDCQALVLGHHADDRSETVLKRVLEGAAITNFASLPERSVVEDMVVWRPLLPLSKQKILCWLQQEGHDAFVDHTNFDTKFLRARMRVDIIPQLSRTFGKNISKNLWTLAEDADELSKYLDARVAVYETIETPLGYLLKDFPENAFELKHLVRSFFVKVGARGLPRDVIEKVARCIVQGGANRKFLNDMCIVDRGKLFYLKDDVSWAVKMRKINNSKHTLTSGWDKVWQGKLSVALPEGDYKVVFLKDMNVSYPGKSSIDKWWSKHKIPRFLCYKVPVVVKEDGQIVHEFLTGKQTYKKDQGPWVKVALKFDNC